MELKRRAHALIASFEADLAEGGREATPEDGRTRELRNKARALLAHVSHRSMLPSQQANHDNKP